MIRKQAFRKQLKILVLIYLLVTIPIWLYGNTKPKIQRHETRDIKSSSPRPVLETESEPLENNSHRSVSRDTGNLSNDSFIGLVSWYGYESCVNKKDCRTANGETYNPEGYTCACWHTYPFNTRFRVCRVDGSHCVIVRCTDRGNFRRLGRFLDLSKAAFRELWDLSKGVSEAKINVIK